MEEIDKIFNDWDIEEETTIPATINNLKVGDTVIVTDRAKEYIKLHAWYGMTKFLNYEYEVDRILNENSSSYCKVYLRGREEGIGGWFFPIDTLDIKI